MVLQICKSSVEALLLHNQSCVYIVSLRRHTVSLHVRAVFPLFRKHFSMCWKTLVAMAMLCGNSTNLLMLLPWKQVHRHLHMVWVTIILVATPVARVRLTRHSASLFRTSYVSSSGNLFPWKRKSVPKVCTKCWHSIVEAWCRWLQWYHWREGVNLKMWLDCMSFISTHLLWWIHVLNG